MSPYIYVNGKEINLESVIDEVNNVVKNSISEGEGKAKNFDQALIEVAGTYGAEGVSLPKEVVSYKAKAEIELRIQLYVDYVISRNGHGSIENMLVKSALGDANATAILQWYSDMVDNQQKQDIKSENLFTWMEAQALPA